MAEAALQKCPNCERAHDVSVYVTGQKLRCSCGIRFEVRREVKPSIPPSSRLSVRAEPPASRQTAVPAASMPGAAAAPAAASPGAAPDPAQAAAAAAGGGADFLEPPDGSPSPPPSSSPSPATQPAPAVVPTRPDRGDSPAQIAPTAVFKRVEIPGYELLELLGKGGMGEVWKARQLSLGRVVAIKVLSPELAKDREFVARFQKEAAALAALSHPNIVQIIERGGDENARLFYFAMELCEGTSLRELMTSGALSLAERLDLVAQIGRAIDYAHGRGVIHRDLKPENILVGAGRQAKVVDFGLAGMRQGQAQLNLTKAATAMGTLHYMAPEQRRDARSVDERADVYSLGVILYELLVGEVPVGRFALPTQKLPGLDPRLDRIVSRALEAEPEARYAHARDLTAEIEAVAAASRQSPPARPGQPGARPRAARQSADVRSRVARWLAIAAAVTLAGLAVGTWVLEPSAPAPAGAGAQSGQGEKQEGQQQRQQQLESRAMPQDTNADLAVSASRRGEDYLQISVEFRPGPEVLKAGSGEWRLREGVLVGRVFGGVKGQTWRPSAVLESPALLADGVMLDATVSVSSTPPEGYTPTEPPRAELMLRGEEGARLSLAATFGPKAGYQLAYRPPEGELVEESRSLGARDELPAAPMLDKPLRLRLSAVAKGEIEIFAGFAEPLPLIFKKRLDVKALQGQAAVGCIEATCRFSRLEVVGRLAQIPKPPMPVDPDPAVAFP